LEQIRRVAAPDPKTNAAAMKTLYDSADRRDETFDALIRLGVHFAVCDKSTQGLAGSLARKTKGKSDAVYKELLANVIGSCIRPNACRAFQTAAVLQPLSRGRQRVTDPRAWCD
jgi:hypothetical protein